MSTANTSIQERGSEWRATAEANMILRILGDLANEPSGKRFNRSRATRIERWSQLAEVAKQQASGLGLLAKSAPRKGKRELPKITPPPAVPSDAEFRAATSPA